METLWDYLGSAAKSDWLLLTDLPLSIGMHSTWEGLEQHYREKLNDLYRASFN